MLFDYMFLFAGNKLNQLFFTSTHFMRLWLFLFVFSFDLKIKKDLSKCFN